MRTYGQKLVKFCTHTHTHTHTHTRRGSISSKDVKMWTVLSTVECNALEISMHAAPFILGLIYV